MIAAVGLEAAQPEAQACELAVQGLHVAWHLPGSPCWPLPRTGT